MALTFFWAIVFDRGRVAESRAFPTREAAVSFGVLHLAAEGIEIVEAATADEAIAIARRARKR